MKIDPHLTLQKKLTQNDHMPLSSKYTSLNYKTHRRKHKDHDLGLGNDFLNMTTAKA